MKTAKEQGSEAAMAVHKDYLFRVGVWLKHPNGEQGYVAQEVRERNPWAAAGFVLIQLRGEYPWAYIHSGTISVLTLGKSVEVDITN